MLLNKAETFKKSFRSCTKNPRKPCTSVVGWRRRSVQWVASAEALLIHLHAEGAVVAEGAVAAAVAVATAPSFATPLPAPLALAPGERRRGGMRRRCW